MGNLKGSRLCTAMSPIVCAASLFQVLQTLTLRCATVLCMAPGNIEMRPGRRVSQLLNVAFDMAAWVSFSPTMLSSVLNAAPLLLQEILGSLSNGCTLCVRGKSSKEWRAVMKTVDIVIGRFLSLQTPRGPSPDVCDIFSNAKHDGYAASFRSSC